MNAVFYDRPDLRWQFVQLYFIRGWSCEGIVAQYGLIDSVFRQIVNMWRSRAAQMGHIQFIPPTDAPVAMLQRSLREVVSVRKSFSHSTLDVGCVT